MAGRPAGLSSDEDCYSDDGFQVCGVNASKYKKQRYQHEFSFKQELTAEQKFIDSIRNGEYDSVVEYVNNGVDINYEENGWSALMNACFYSNVEIIELLVKHGADVTFHKDFFTLLMGVCNGRNNNEENRLRCIDILVTAGVDVNAVDRYRNSALMIAAKEGQSKIVKRLIEHGAKVNKIDKNGWTALFFAVKNRRREVVDILVEAGTNLRIKDRHDQTAYDIAVNKEFDEIADKVMFEDLSKGRISKDVQVKHILRPDDMIGELPSRNGANSLSGFPSDVYGLLLGMNLQHLAHLFYSNNIQLGQFLVISDDRLKELGVRLSVHRRRILECIKSFHLQRWLRSSVGYKMTNEKIEILDAIKMKGNTVRQIHVMQCTLLYLDLHKPKEGLSKSVVELLDKMAHQVYLTQNELFTQRDYTRQLEDKRKLVPADLILPKKPTIKLKSFVIKACTICLIGMLLWKNKQVYARSFYKVPLFFFLKQ